MCTFIYIKEKEGFKGVGIDISKDCLDVCKNNINKLKLNNKINLYKSDIDNFNYGKYDLIISNPPYIKNTDFKYLGKMIEFEPKLALDGELRWLVRNQKSN